MGEFHMLGFIFASLPPGFTLWNFDLWEDAPLTDGVACPSWIGRFGTRREARTVARRRVGLATWGDDGDRKRARRKGSTAWVEGPKADGRHWIYRQVFDRAEPTFGATCRLKAELGMRDWG